MKPETLVRKVAKQELGKGFTVKRVDGDRWRIQTKKPCKVCEGNPEDMPEGWHQCPSCYGSGKRSHDIVIVALPPGSEHATAELIRIGIETDLADVGA